MRCALCEQKIFHKRGLKTRLCSSCLTNIFPVMYQQINKDKKQKLIILFSLDKTIKEIVYLFKFNNKIILAQTMAALIMEHLNLVTDLNLIIPVPSHFIDEAKRGYPHIVCVANKISKIIDVPYKNVLKKKFFPIINRHQKTKNRKNRLLNIKRYYLPDYYKKQIENKNILLIDDVYTSGATITECSEILIKNGANNVISYCFALTPY